MSLRKDVSELKKRIISLENLCIRIANEHSFYANKRTDSYGSYWDLRPMVGGSMRTKFTALINHLGLYFKLPSPNKVELVKKKELPSYCSSAITKEETRAKKSTK